MKAGSNKLWLVNSFEFFGLMRFALPKELQISTLAALVVLLFTEQLPQNQPSVRFFEWTHYFRRRPNLSPVLRFNVLRQAIPPDKTIPDGSKGSKPAADVPYCLNYSRCLNIIDTFR